MSANSAWSLGLTTCMYREWSIAPLWQSMSEERLRPPRPLLGVAIASAQRQVDFDRPFMGRCLCEYRRHHRLRRARAEPCMEIGNLHFLRAADLQVCVAE
jgi:hypothetical protein